MLLDLPGRNIGAGRPVVSRRRVHPGRGHGVFAGGSLAIGSFTQNGGAAQGYTVDINANNTIILQGGSLVADNAVPVDPAGTITLPAWGTLQTGGVTAPMAGNWTNAAVSFAQFSASLGTWQVSMSA